MSPLVSKTGIVDGLEVFFRSGCRVGGFFLGRKRLASLARRSIISCPGIYEWDVIQHSIIVFVVEESRWIIC